MKYLFFTLLCLLLFAVSCSNESELKELTNQSTSSEETLTVPPDPFESKSEKIKDRIRFIFEEKGEYERLHILDERLFSSVLLPKVYIKQKFHPIWISNKNSLLFIDEYIMYIESLRYHGLQPSDYHLEQIQHYRSTIENDSLEIFNVAALDILLSDAFFMISSHLYNGKINPESLQSEWGIQRQRPELELDEKLLLLLNKEQSVNEFMERFYPIDRNYKLLLRTSEKLWKDTISEIRLSFPTVRLPLDLYEDSTFTPQVLKRLIELDYISEQNDSSTVDDVVSAIQQLQASFGLNTDGKIGSFTLEALNLTREEKLQKILVNMERMRWLPDEKSARRILVNIADFTLDYITDNDTLISMKTVVGRNFRQTPVFEAKMTYLVFSPTWTIPPGILRNDVLPAIAKDISYLSKNNMVVLDRTGKTIDAHSIDWQKARTGNFPYMIRQMPGDQNALGRVKFMFPNKYNVYLHDTPSKSLFDRDERTFSSGCIRISKPAELAKLLLNNEEKWNSQTIAENMRLSREKTVLLPEAVGVYIYYLTAWGDEKYIHFRKDIYDRDQEVYRSLMTNN